jgi:hypothetical protein
VDKSLVFQVGLKRSGFLYQVQPKAGVISQKISGENLLCDKANFRYDRDWRDLCLRRH